MKKFTILSGLLVFAVFLFFAMPVYADSDDHGKGRGKQKTVYVNCAKGKTIAKALEHGDKRNGVAVVLGSTGIIEGNTIQDSDESGILVLMGSALRLQGSPAPVVINNNRS